MQRRENEKERGHIRFKEEDVLLATQMLAEMDVMMDIMYYLMRRKEERAFVIVLIKAEEVDIASLIEGNKRSTDIFFALERVPDTAVVICQDTRVDGGYHFASRIRTILENNGAKGLYMVELEVGSTQYDKKYVVFRLVELFIKAKEEKQEGEIVYKSLR